MAIVSPTTLSTNQHSEIEALRRRFVERFKDAVTSVAGCVDLAAGFVSPFSSDSIAKSRTCHCLQATALVPQSASPCRRGRRRFEKDVRCGKVILGRVWACYDGADRSLAAVIDYMVDAASKLVNLEEEEEALLEELSSCWENLEAVYEISSDTGSIQNPRELLDRIVGRALSLSTGLAGVLWIEEGAALQPIVTKNAMEMEPRDPSLGLIGKALSCFCASIINGRDEIVAAEGPNPELERAASAAVIPLMTRHGFLGVLELWNEEEGSRFHSRDVKLLQTLAHQAGTVVENERLHRASIDTMRLRHEVEIGSNIQQALLVARTPRGLSNLKVAAISIPSQSIDGDFYDFIKHRDYCVDVLVGDVMGKGIPAALVGAATKTSFLRAMGQWSGALERHGIPSPEEIVTLVHRDMTRQLIGLESFATACYARFNTYLETVEIVDCGHPRTIRYSRRSDACEMLAGDNMPLGFSEREIYKQFSVPLDKGDVFLFYSDGLTEAKSPDGEFFGEERVAESLKKYANLAAHQIVRRIQNEVSVFAASDILADDLTCVVVKVTSNEPGAKRSDEMEVASSLRELADVREFVRNACRTLPVVPLDDQATAAFELVVNEAAANIIKHAYAGREDRLIQIEAEADDESLSFELGHFGVPFEPKVPDVPAFDGSREGGFGLFIISQLADKVSYSTDDTGRHVVRLAKRLEGGGRVEIRNEE